MEDEAIVELYWQRSETAIQETERKYSRYGFQIVNNILHDDCDAEECLNDAYMRLWEAIPPTRPNHLSAFLGKVVRNLSLNRYEKQNAQKRGSGEMSVVLAELEECIADASSESFPIETLALTEVINHFLENLSPSVRKIFVRRYWYADSIEEVASFYGISSGKVKSALFRTRAKLKTYLEKEGITL